MGLILISLEPSNGVRINPSHLKGSEFAMVSLISSSCSRITFEISSLWIEVFDDSYKHANLGYHLIGSDLLSLINLLITLLSCLNNLIKSSSELIISVLVFEV